MKGVRLLVKLALLVGLQVQLSLMIASSSSSNSEAFQFWPSRSSSKIAHQERPTSAPPTARHRPETRPDTNTTTRSTTSAPIELHFELNAEPPQALQPIDESSFEMKTLNGSLILEDLVNQFEQNFKQKRRALEPADEVESAPPYGPNKTAPAERHLAEIMVEPTSEISLELLQATSSAAPFEPSANDSLVDLQQADHEDRHIQYDTMRSSSPGNEIDESGPPSATEAARARDLTFGPGAPDALSRNFTLEPVRVDSERMEWDKLHRRQESSSAEEEDSSQVIYSNNTLLVMPATGQREQQASQKWQLARSMSNSAAGGVRAPQHSKPPYASYNQFHQSRPKSAGPPVQLITTNSHNNNRTSFQSDSAHGNAILQQPAPIGAGRPEAVGAPDSKLQAASELVNSINRISSHLADEAARQQAESNSTATTTTSTSSASSASNPSSSAARPPSAADVVAHSYELLRERQQAQQQKELERVASKLAPVNDPIDLSPIAASAATDGQLHQVAAGELGPNQLYFAQAPSGGHEGSRAPAPAAESSAHKNFQRFQNDRYSYAGAAFDATNLFSQQLSEPANQLFVSAAESGQAPSLKQLSARATTSPTDPPSPLSGHSQPHELDEATPRLGSHTPGSAAASSLSLPFGPQLSRKTLELVSNQIQHADQTAGAVRQHKERSPNPLEQQQQRGPGPYAASLINVTAPMVLPLSATEAMEASVGADPAARLMMHQVGGGTSLGLAGSGPGASLQDLHAPHGLHQRPLMSGAYRPAGQLAPGPHRDERHRESAYSTPAKAFSSRPVSHSAGSSYAPSTSGSEQTFAGPSASVDGSPGAGAEVASAASALSAEERERLRVRELARTSAAGQQASGFRSPFTQGAAYLAGPDNSAPTSAASSQTTSLPTPLSYSGGAASGRFSAAGGSSTQAPPAATQATNSSSSVPQANRSPSTSADGPPLAQNFTTPGQHESGASGNQAHSAATTNGFLTGAVSAGNSSSESQTLAGGGQQQAPQASSQLQAATNGAAPNKRVFNLTRVEHISAECSNDLIRTLIIFNGTFKGIIYSSGYVRDPNCMYVNGTGKTRYDFSIRLNQCGTLGRQELHPSSRPNELNRRDQVMWNTLSIQYNPIVEQEWDEHFRVSCEYGGDFWKTISFSPFNVETNTGAPVVFTVDPPQCQMEILKGHGMVGPRQEAVSGPVTVGDPLTLLIHMKSEKAGYDILVKNCIAHNGGQQKMQLIDNSGCVVNERFISPFRGTYNDNDLKHVTLYSYLKAFRFTGSPVLYLECEVHMCQSACPPQMCYWRTLSKRSINETRLLAGADGLPDNLADSQFDLSDSEPLEDDLRSLRFNLTASTSTSTTTTSTSTSTSTEPSVRQTQRRGRNLRHAASRENATKPASENLSDRVSLFQALEVRQEREPENLPEPFVFEQASRRLADERQLEPGLILCYRRAEVFAFLFTVASVLLAAISLTVGCCLRASSLKRQARHQAAKSKRQQQQQQFVSQALSLTSANLGYAPLTSYLSPSPSTLSSGGSSGAGSSQPSPTSGACCYSPEVAASGAKQSAELPACSVSSLGALIKQQQQQLKLAEAATRKSSCQTRFSG